MFPQDEAGFSLDDQFYVGDSGLLVKPVTRPGVSEETVYIPEDKASTFQTRFGGIILKARYDRFTMTTLRIRRTAALRRAST
jgi:hypothetical protein